MIIGRDRRFDNELVDDDVAEGMQIMLAAGAERIPCTIVSLHREADGFVSQIILRREDTGTTHLGVRTHPGPDAKMWPLLKWLVHGARGFMTASLPVGVVPA
jgi:hypothetical protein